MRILLVVVVALVAPFLPACTNNCSDRVSVHPVLILDGQTGGIAPTAVVTATNLDKTGMDTQIASEGGIAHITEKVGGGTVRYVATIGTRQSVPVDVEWTCDECHCRPAPGSVDTITVP